MIEELRATLKALPFADVFPYGVMLLTVSLMAAALVIELAVLGWANSSARKLLKPTASIRRDLGYFLLSATGLNVVIGYAMTFGAGYFAGKYAADLVGFHMIGQIPNIPLQVLALFLLNGFMFYWLHRLYHEIPALWEIHKYHHSAEEFCIVTAHRAHPLEKALNNVIMSFVLAALGGNAWQILLVNVPHLLHVNLVHSGIKWNYGWFGRWIWLSPHAHKVHHSTNPVHFGSNMGLDFVLWDRLFGTFYQGAIPVDRLGADEPSYNRDGFIREMLSVIGRALAHVIPSAGRTATKP